MEHELRITYGTSRGRDTYGYTLVNLYERGEKKASCNGGGYDMRGTVFADWLQATYQDRLVALAKTKKKGVFDRRIWNAAMGDDSTYKTLDADRKVHLYGGKYYENGARATIWDRKGENVKGYKAVPPYVELDGGCGFESMRRIAEAIGLKLRTLSGGKNLDIILIEDTRPAKE
jgi:hypothetical protein